MGNCQAADAAAVVIQHPGGKVERLHGPATAADVMRSNPGHYVALVVVLRVSGPAAGVARTDPAVAAGAGAGGASATKVTKVKLLKPKDALLLGQVYRLITSQEVAKAIQARRQDRLLRRCEDADNDRRPRRPGQSAAASGQEQGQSTEQGQERKRPEKVRPRSSGGARSGRGGRHWQPSLHSISEFPS